MNSNTGQKGMGKAMEYPAKPDGCFYLSRVCPKRVSESHKGDYGTAVLFCGSVGFAGAAYFASHAATLSGVGLVHLVVPDSIYAPLALATPEVMVHPCTANNFGRLTEHAYEVSLPLLQKADTVLIGCGLGCDRNTAALVAKVLTQFSGNVVLDADGINAVKDHPDLLRRNNLVITPHEGELARLGFKRGPDETRADAAKRIAPMLGCSLVLKGPHTAVVSADGTCYENNTGNPGMSKGGSGDILAGLLAGFSAHHNDIFEAAAAAVYIHGKAGDMAAQSFGEVGTRPSDTLHAIPQAIHQTLHY